MNWQIFSLIVITLLGAAIRIVNIDGPLWLDELHSSWSVSGSLGEVAPRAAAGNQPPLYYWTAWIVVQLLGQTEFTLRLISLIPGIAMIPLAWAIVNRFSRSVAGSLLAALLIAFDPQLIFFSTEFRGYICVTFFGMIQVAVFAHLLTGSMVAENAIADSETEKVQAAPQTKVGWKTRLLFCGLTVLLFNLHITAILILLPEIALTIIALCSSRFRARYAVTDFLIDGVIIAVGCLPLAFLVMGIESKRGDWAPMVRAWKLNSEQIDFLRIIVGYLIPLIVACGIYAGITHRQRKRTSKKSKRKQKIAVNPTGNRTAIRTAAIFLSCAVVIIGTVWLLTSFKLASLFLPRYASVVMAIPAVAAGLIVGAFSLRIAHLRAVQWIVAGLLLTVVSIATVQYNGWAAGCLSNKVVLPMRHEPWGAVVDTLNAQSDPNKVTPVFLMSTLVEDYRLFSEFEPTDSFVEYCKFPLSGIYNLDRTKHRIIPIPSLVDRQKFTEPRVPQNVLDYISDGTNAACIVSRGEPVLFDVLNELELGLNDRGRRLLLEKPLDQSNIGRMYLVRFSSGPALKNESTNSSK